jgi:hypothetical protein
MGGRQREGHCEEVDRDGDSGSGRHVGVVVVTRGTASGARELCLYGRIVGQYAFGLSSNPHCIFSPLIFCKPSLHLQLESFFFCHVMHLEKKGYALAFS